MSPQLVISRITLRTIVLYGCSFLGILLFIGYVLFQARFIIEGPEITITSPHLETYTDRMVVLEGTVHNIVRMSLDGRQIFTDENGNFREALVLENGYTIATLHAVDRYGRTKDLTQGFVYVPKEVVTN